jgi:hypothetical protein
MQLVQATPSQCKTQTSGMPTTQMSFVVLPQTPNIGHEEFHPAGNGSAVQTLPFQ